MDEKDLQRIEQRLERIEQKLDNLSDWKQVIELRLSSAESKLSLASWVLSVLTVIMVSGGMGFIWALITDTINIVKR